MLCKEPVDLGTSVMDTLGLDKRRISTCHTESNHSLVPWCGCILYMVVLKHTFSPSNMRLATSCATSPLGSNGFDRCAMYKATFQRRRIP